MHTKTETQSPRSKPPLSLFPSLLHPSTHSTLVPSIGRSSEGPSNGPKIAAAAPSQNDGETAHQRAHHIDHRAVSAFLVNFMTHMFAPVGYQACTSTAPCWAPSAHEAAAVVDCVARKQSNKRAVIVVDDEFVLLEDRAPGADADADADADAVGGEQDGGPICREAQIAKFYA